MWRILLLVAIVIIAAAAAVAQEVNFSTTLLAEENAPEQIPHVDEEHKVLFSPNFHTNTRSMTSSMGDAIVFAVSLVFAFLILPLALAYRIVPQFRNAVLALTQQQQILPAVAKRGAEDFAKDDYFRPTLLPSTFRSMLRSEDVERLLGHLPTNITYKDWQLLYASELHGFNLHTAYRKCQDMGPCLLVVMDFHRHVMAAYVSETLQPVNGRRFFGNGECFVASIFPKFEPHHYTAKAAQEFVMATDTFLAFGGGGKAFALWMDSSFDRATSEPNEVFGNPASLASSEAFKCAAVEIWSFALPKLSLRTKAMSAVLGRMKE